jgi:hypothetical protein
VIEEGRRDFECWRCGAEVTSATWREITNDGWVFYRVYGTAVARPKPTMAEHAPADDGCTVELCGDCAAMLRALRAIRASRGVPELRP